LWNLRFYLAIGQLRSHDAGKFVVR
jgi:hypothetical protein